MVPCCCKKVMTLTKVIDQVFCFFDILSIPEFLNTDFGYNKQSVRTVFKNNRHYLNFLKIRILDMKNCSDNS